MARIIKNIKIYSGADVIENGYLRFSDKIEAIGKMDDFHAQDGDQEITYEQKAFIVPGFIDVHTHGGYGFDTMDADPAAMDIFSEHLRHEGITSFFPTTITQTKIKIEKALRAVKVSYRNNPMVAGVHLEGPFINPEMNGAQPKEFVLRADAGLLKSWQIASGGSIKLVTYAPEKADSAFESSVHNMGVVLSAGHSDQSYFKMNRGQTLASHVTHLYNRQSQLQGREPGVSGYALLTPPVMTEIISDGIHVAPEMLSLAYKLKGAGSLELVTDSMRAKGQKENEVSELGGQKVTIKNGAARLENGHLAGSVLKFIDAFKNIQKFTGASIEEAVLMASVNQAHEFGLEDVGELAVGKRADFNLLSESKQELVDNFLNGQPLLKVGGKK
ncbi:N-acetylglucosamine-6-phosphate deacetylase [Oenococcus alcoholitolerans]|uniref:N-acetylglucosamine-6-phosphate deacetylase n=1 Tax=Oenococcus alcoholitolerans TaxID=931074 RepID=UPI003F709D2A